MNKTGVIILAAGSSSRLGHSKQLLSFRGKTLLQLIIDEAELLDLEQKVLVLGANADNIRQSVTAGSFTVVINEHWEEGIASSIRIGLAKLLELDPGLDEALFLLSDQPFVSADHIRELLSVHERHGKAITASQYKDTVGVPALFSRELFNELLDIHGDRGASVVMHRHQEQLTAVAFSQGAIDVDTPEDVDRLQELSDQ